MRYAIPLLIIILLLFVCNDPIKEIKEQFESSHMNLDSVNINIDVLVDKLKNADSVVLVSHIDNNFIRTKDKDGIEQIESVPLCDSLKPNERIIKERKQLSKELIDTLCKILSKKPINDSSSAAACFIPHHTIFLFKKSKLSFVDICFTCQEFFTSPDLKNTVDFIEDEKWRRLKHFFKSVGLKYELEK